MIGVLDAVAGIVAAATAVYAGFGVWTIWRDVSLRTRRRTYAERVADVSGGVPAPVAIQESGATDMNSVQASATCLAGNRPVHVPIEATGQFEGPGIWLTLQRQIFDQTSQGSLFLQDADSQVEEE